MKGVVSFHPVDVSFFDDTVQPLASGEKINPEAYLSAAGRQRSTAGYVDGFRRGLQHLIEISTPPPAPPEASRWLRLRTWMERVDYRPDPLATTAARVVDEDLHLYGRPFLVTESSPEKVAVEVDRFVEAESQAVVHELVLEQVRRLDPSLGDALQPDLEVMADGIYRSEMLQALKEVHDLTRAARQGGAWSGPDGSVPACTAVTEQLPWLAVRLHAQVVPYWTARDVDGLEAVCSAAGVPPPEALMPAWRLFGPLCDEFPALKDRLELRLEGDRQVGAYVAPDDIPGLLEFLGATGARIIQAATRAGEGPPATLYLRKIKECATYAAVHGLGYLEASGLGVLGARPAAGDTL